MWVFMLGGEDTHPWSAKKKERKNEIFSDAMFKKLSNSTSTEVKYNAVSLNKI